MDHFDDLRNGIEKKQLLIIDKIWQYYCENDFCWPPVRILHHHFGKKPVLDCIESLGGSIVVRADDSTYHLTFLGVLLTSRGDLEAQAVVRYLEYARERFVADPEVTEITSADVARDLGLEGREAYRLYDLIQSSPFRGNGGSSNRTDWHISVPEVVDELPLTGLGEIVRSTAMSGYDPKTPTDAYRAYVYRQKSGNAILHEAGPQINSRHRSTPRTETYIGIIKNNRFLAILIIVGIAVIALASFADAINSLLDFFRRLW